jgi:hypothetical protein
MPFPAFDRSRLKIKPLAERKHELDLSAIMPLDVALPAFHHPALPILAERILAARQREAAVILMMGAHVLRAGVQHFLIDLMERRLVTHVAMNGAGPIHDWELALIGATTESVARYIQTGEFGLWQETGRMNDVILASVGGQPPESASGGRQPSELGLGESLGRAILESDFPHKDLSILAAGVRLGVPVTVHVGIGYDIIHEHPNCDGAALGQLSYQDFLVFAKAVENLEGGVLLSFGSAVMGPEVYLKALSMARNVAEQEGRSIRRFTTAVFDLMPLEGDFRQEAPKTDPRYYYRPWKTILVRTVADGGESYYVQRDHRATVPGLWRELGTNGRAFPRT